MIQGVAIAQGTDPEGNFRLMGVTIDGAFSDAAANALHDLRIPPHSVYSFQVSYKPRHFEPANPNAVDEAVIDIAYAGPKTGIMQVALKGIPVARAPSCPSSDEVTANGVGDLNGVLSIIVNRIALVTTALPAAISTDIHTKHAFSPVELPVTFGGETNTIVLHKISEELAFNLPPTSDPPLNTTIAEDTLVTSNADAHGVYGDDGSIILENVSIHLDEKFHADFVVTLTTGVLDIPEGMPPSLLESAGLQLSVDSTKILGSVINSETFDVRLIGIGDFINASGTGTVAQNLKGGGVSGIVIIEATVKQ